MGKQASQMCFAILILLSIFLLYQIICNCNKKSITGGEANAPVEETTNEVVESAVESNVESDVESDSELDFNDPDYYNYEPVVNENGLEDEVTDAPVEDASNTVENVETEPVKVDNGLDISGLDASDSFHMLDSNETNTMGNAKLNPADLLPQDSKNMEGQNFLTASLSKSEQIIGVPTQTQRSRKNYDLRSSPPNPQVEVSPWNMSTMEPDTGRLSFEIGQSNCVCE